MIYVATLLTAIAIILLEVGRMQSPSPLFMEKQLAHVLQWREEQLLMDFVIAGTREQKIPADPRFLQYKRIIAANPRPWSEMEEQVAWLKAALAQLNFNIDVKDPKPGIGKDGASQTQQMVAHDGQGNLFQPRKAPYKFKLGEIEYAALVLPGNALPNLNAIPYEALWRYLATLQIPEEEVKSLAAALIDWRDPDDLRTEGLGAESDYYYNLRPPYMPRNAPIRSWQELGYVRGMTPERVRLLRDNFMLGGPGQGGLSLDFGSLNAFVALSGLRLETVKDILTAYGRLGDKNAGVGDVAFSQDTTDFDRVMSLKADTSLLRIRITSPESTMTADYDARNRKVIAMW